MATDDKHSISTLCVDAQMSLRPYDLLELDHYEIDQTDAFGNTLLHLGARKPVSMFARKVLATRFLAGNDKMTSVNPY
jgi:hypothetical protein